MAVHNPGLFDTSVLFACLVQLLLTSTC